MNSLHSLVLICKKLFWKCFNLSNLEVNIKETSNEDPELVVVESSEGANELEEGLKIQIPLSIVHTVIQSSP